MNSTFLVATKIATSPTNNQATANDEKRAEQALNDMQRLGFCKWANQDFHKSSILKATKIWYAKYDRDTLITKEQFKNLAWAELKESKSHYLHGLKESHLEQLFELYGLNQTHANMNLMQFCHAFFYFERPVIEEKKNETVLSSEIELLSSVKDQLGKEPLFCSREKREEKLRPPVQAAADKTQQEFELTEQKEVVSAQESKPISFLLSLSEGGVETTEKGKVSYGMNLILSVYNPHEKLVLRTELIYPRLVAEDAIFVDHRGETPFTDLSFLKKTVEWLYNYREKPGGRELRRQHSTQRNPLQLREDAFKLWGSKNHSRRGDITTEQFKELIQPILNDPSRHNPFTVGLTPEYLDQIFNLIVGTRNGMKFLEFANLFTVISCQHPNFVDILDAFPKSQKMEPQVDPDIQRSRFTPCSE